MKLIYSNLSKAEIEDMFEPRYLTLARQPPMFYKANYGIQTLKMMHRITMSNAEEVAMIVYVHPKYDSSGEYIEGKFTGKDDLELYMRAGVGVDFLQIDRDIGERIYSSRETRVNTGSAEKIVAFTAKTLTAAPENESLQFYLRNVTKDSTISSLHSANFWIVEHTVDNIPNLFDTNLWSRILIQVEDRTIRKYDTAAHNVSCDYANLGISIFYRNTVEKTIYNDILEFPQMLMSRKPTTLPIENFMAIFNNDVPINLTIANFSDNQTFLTKSQTLMKHINVYIGIMYRYLKLYPNLVPVVASIINIIKRLSMDADDLTLNALYFTNFATLHRNIVLPHMYTLLDTDRTLELINKDVIKHDYK